ncbi:MAG: hypothetical protein ACO1OG_01325 [Devosia sp.]
MPQTTDDLDPIPATAPAVDTSIDSDAIAAVEGSATPHVISEDEPLLDDQLEEGIASIFAALHSATDGAQDVPAEEEATHDDDDLAEVDLSTFRLLGELDRLWHRAA